MKKTIFCILIILAVTLLIPATWALRFTDNIYFTIPKDDIECIDLILPDDVGVILPGLFEYTITMTPDTVLTWSDLSEQTVRTDENNTVTIPICFSSIDKLEGTCGEEFTITIEGDSLPPMMSRGQACVSELQDVDNDNPGGDNPGDGINNNADLFDLAFLRPTQYAQPNEEKNFLINIESYADITLDLSVESDLQASLSKRTITLSNSTPRDSVTLTATGSNLGEHNITVTGVIRGCSDTFCDKQTSGKLIVTENVPDQASFLVSLFPSNLNVKDLIPVSYDFTILNNGDEADFYVDIETLAGIETSFQPQTITIGSNAYKTVSFTLTPTNISAFYEIKVSAASNGVTKYATTSLSTNELLTDAMRQAGDNQNSLDSFYNDYRDTSYGDELDSYSSFRNNLPSNQPPGNQNGNASGNGNGDHTEPSGLPVWIIIIPIILVIVLVVVFIFIKKRPTKFQVKDLEGI